MILLTSLTMTLSRSVTLRTSSSISGSSSPKPALRICRCCRRDLEVRLVEAVARPAHLVESLLDLDDSLSTAMTGMIRARMLCSSSFSSWSLIG